MTTPTSSRAQAKQLRALVWKRSDFRETSRLITLITRERGKLVALGKGAHRPSSQCLGRIDFLNLLEVKISRGNLPVVHRVLLLHEHRKLRHPVRFAAASYLTEIFDVAFPPDRSDPKLFDLLTGGLLLIERCDTAALPQILMGIELRFLHELGLQPPLLACSLCESTLADGSLYAMRSVPGLACRKHAEQRRAVPAAALAWMADIAGSPGRTWPTQRPAPTGAQELLGHWIAAAIDKPPRLRAAAFLF